MIGFFMFILTCILVSYMFFDSLWLSILSTILFANLINILFPKLFSGEDMYSDEAINKAKQQNYSKNRMTPQMFPINYNKKAENFSNPLQSSPNLTSNLNNTKIVFVFSFPFISKSEK